MESQEMVSVIMSVYNEKKEICSAAVESVLGQTLKDIELVIVIDNPENTDLAELVERFSEKDPRVVILRNENNIGLAPSLNRAIQGARGEYIARMDADDLSIPNRLEVQKAYLEQNGLDLIGGGLIVMGPESETIYKIDRIPRTARIVQKCLGTADCVPHGTWFGKRNMFIDLNGYRNLPVSQDYDFLVRAALAGYRISNLIRPVYRFRRIEEADRSGKLWRQYLCLKMISREYRRGREVPLDKLEKYINDRMESAGAKRFEKAENAFYRMLGHKERREYGAFLIEGIRLLSSGSLSYCDRILRFAKLSFYAGVSRNAPE